MHDRTRPSRGQIAYEAECAFAPVYHDGAPRRSWLALDDVARWSWERNPTPRRWTQRLGAYGDLRADAPLDAAAIARAVSYQCEWGIYWARTAHHHPLHRDACAHNAHMNAAMVQALEALQ